MGKNIAEAVSELVLPYVTRLGFELYDVEYVKEGTEYYLRIYIDKPDGAISSDDCETVSRAIDPVLDEADPIPDSYYLEVSSVGLDRPLKKQKDFERFTGQKIEVRLFKAADGVKEFVGTLTGFDGDSFTVDIEGQSRKVLRKDASLIRPYIDFNDFTD